MRDASHVGTPLTDIQFRSKEANLPKKTIQISVLSQKAILCLIAQYSKGKTLTIPNGNIAVLLLMLHDIIGSPIKSGLVTT